MPHSFIASSPFSGDSERQWFSRAGACFNNGDFAEAARLWEQQRAKYPHEAMLHFVLGRCKQMERAYDEALALYTTVLELDPGFHPASYYTGSVLLERAEYLKAIEVFSTILQRHPGDADTWTLLGGALSKTGDYDAASECCHQALRLNPAEAGAMYNLSIASTAKGSVREALKWIEAALRFKPDVPLFHMQRASLLLREGRYGEGWREWEWRLQKADFRALNARSAAPCAWKGESLQGRTLLVWCEQGLSDTVQFARFLPAVRARGARVLFECQKELIPIVAAMGGADVVFERFGESPEPFDYHAPLMSLPLHFGTTPETIPAAEGYLDPDLMRPYAGRFPFPDDAMRIGLAWEGSRLNAVHHHRSCPVEAYAPVFRLPGCRFFGLQHRAGEAPLPGAITDLGMRSMAELAGAIASLDLVITIDATVAHLAGAMGKNVWLLLSALPDWRWELERASTPWYGSMRLIRQRTIGDWLPVMKDAAERLRSHIAHVRPRRNRTR